MVAMPSWPCRTDLLLCLALAALTLTAFHGVLDNGFVNYDDPGYVTQNPGVQAGLTPASLAWALTTTQQSNWHPLTWLSLQLDYELFGLDPRGYHRTNLLLHLANILLCYGVWRQLTGAVWRSACVAALFAVHPLRVESVAWVAERKDVLSTCFGLLSLGAYAAYARRPGRGRYLAVAGTLLLSLLAKPMLVTLPFVFLLLDYWPLERWRPARGVAALDARRLLAEKLPLLALSSSVALVAILAQARGAALLPGEDLPFAQRFLNALTAYVAYIGMTLWPRGLAPLYPHPRETLSATVALAAGALLLAITALVVRSRRPYLVVGWLWYLGTLVPVIGLVQVGEQALADRYTYVPLLGLYVAGTWGVAELAGRWRVPAWVLAVGVAGVLAACVVRTREQVALWHDSITLWQHTLAVTTANPVAHHNLAAALLAEGRLEEALPHQQAIAALFPRYPPVVYHVGKTLEQLGRPAEAVAWYRRVAALAPGDVQTRIDLAGALAAAGQTDEAAREFRETLRLAPGWPEAANRAAWLRATHPDAQQRDGALAVQLATRACQATAYARPDFLDTLAAAHAEAGRFAEAAAVARQALTLAAPPLAASLQARLQLYEERRPYRDAGASAQP